ncbi:DUF6088 family protein [Planktothrix paucivesiculata]|uniref:AbiEi antitoxin C-terminal domain-containing protein n=1 Tax=Planktothrix paucivesiculata PCC 9631 TaxID=671071 RepID=A0A7Z9BNU0_9CYAN|nr:DUF6088 family protein [Planktothrix paucivesiculata]VXD16905.1 conserved hypothetical protein [Planktothrix paucivesiculata PCC 9631]
MKRSRVNTAALIRRQIEEGGESYWRHSDFSNLPSAAVSKALCRLVADGVLERVSKGLYYRSRPTRFGRSRPSQHEIQKLLTKQNLHPAGLSAANLLGFTTQNSIQGEFATSANSVPRTLIGSRVRLYTRRPQTWNNLEATDAALLDFLRYRGNLSELSPAETKRRLLDYFRDGDRFERLVSVADAEPPRVRAMLGAIGQELRKSPQELEKLRNSLNPVSRFNFGKLSNLRYAKEWQANRETI